MQHGLTPAFSPRSVIIIQPREASSSVAADWGEQMLQRLQSEGYAGRVDRVSRDQSGTLHDLMRSNADLAILPPDLDDLPQTLELAARIGCKSALSLCTHIDAEQSRQLRHLARRLGVTLLGPQGLGLQRPWIKLNASRMGDLAPAGSIALVAQSGAMTSSILDWARHNQVGFSALVHIGHHSVTGIAPVLDFLATDPRTQSIVLHLEGVHNARAFASALRAAAHSKPVIVLKSGRSMEGRTVSRQQRGVDLGEDQVFDAVLRRAGAVRVHSFIQLFSAAKCLASRFRPNTRNLAVIANGLGPALLAADHADDQSLPMAHLEEASRERLRALVPPHLHDALQDGLVLLPDDVSPEQLGTALEVANSDSQTGGILVLMAPHPVGDPLGWAQTTAQLAPRFGKPVITCWMGDASVIEARRVLVDAGLPAFRTPEAAVDAFGNIATFFDNQQLLQQTPPPLAGARTPDLDGARLLLEGILADRRTVLSEVESKALLSAFHIPVTSTHAVRSATEAILVANQLGYPVALKVDSPDIAHKSAVNGVYLGLANGTDVRDSWERLMRRVRRAAPEARLLGATVQRMSDKPRGRELCIRVVSKPPFGPVITLGAGGAVAELLGPRASELPPLNQFLAQQLIGRARLDALLGDWQGAPPVDREAIERILLRVSEMVCELPQLSSLEINPLIVDEHGAVAVDARLELHQQYEPLQPYQHLTILPYPAAHDQEWPLKSGDLYRVRPIRPDDADRLQALVRGLSPESRYMRYVSHMTELPPRMLARFTLIDYDREMALVAVHTPRAEGSGEPGEEAIMGVSRYIIQPDNRSCEFSLVVAQSAQGNGVGSRLMLSLMEHARGKGLATMEGLVLARNTTMLKLMRTLGFSIGPYDEDPDFRLVVKPLQAAQH
ncbi:GNAT family N-acetyltransferase [Amphibiibacter pelophylacis]|uniref:GNAT family N-acetyltransferase n=1 Tax=Amphibiibacter pelophylacis TaxID=1799477 RepID=A0ACC6P1U6_9BURK